MSRIVIITGSTRGIGFATAFEFLRNGDQVVIFCRHQGHVKQATDQLQRLADSREVQDLLALAYMSQGMEGQRSRPLPRTDRGSPNLEGGTKRLIRDLEMILSPGRADSPTDNSRQERWYRPVKQEEIYLYPTYPSLEIARASLARYIAFHNERRPHQALWHYTPAFVHCLGNKSRLIERHRLMVQHVKEQRLRANRVGSQNAILKVQN
jgi:hypothetical protein